MDDELIYDKGIEEMGIRREKHKINMVRPGGGTYYGDDKGEQTYQIVRYDSCDDLINKITRGINEYGWKHKGFGDHDIKPGARDRWTYGQLGDYEKTLEYLREGKVLDSVLRKASEVYNSLTTNPKIEEMMLRAATFKRRTVYREEGSELCIDRVMCGDPMHWGKSTKGRKNTLVRLGVNLAGNCMENESLFNNITAVAGVVCDLLTRAGFAVEINSCSTSFACTTIRGYQSTCVTLKRAEDALDLQRIYSVGCSGFFRCWIFKSYTNVLYGRPYSSLGQTRSVDPSMIPYLGYDYIIDSKFAEAKSQSVHIENMFNEIISHHI